MWVKFLEKYGFEDNYTKDNYWPEWVYLNQHECLKTVEVVYYYICG